MPFLIGILGDGFDGGQTELSSTLPESAKPHLTALTRRKARLYTHMRLLSRITRTIVSLIV